MTLTIDAMYLFVVLAARLFGVDRQEALKDL